LWIDIFDSDADTDAEKYTKLELHFHVLHSALQAHMKKPIWQNVPYLTTCGWHTGGKR